MTDAMSILGRAKESGAYQLGPAFDAWGLSASTSTAPAEFNETKLNPRAYHCGTMRAQDGQPLRARQVRAPSSHAWNLQLDLQNLRMSHNTLRSDRMGLMDKLQSPMSSPVIAPALDRHMATLNTLKIHKIKVGSALSTSADSLLTQFEAFQMGDMEDLDLGGSMLGKGASACEEEEDW